jgi:centrosomal protein CEP104
MILKLHSDCPRVFKIQLLLHHYKIPSRIEIGIATHPDKFNRLGYVSLGDNSNNSYKARELKTVHIDARCQYVQFSFHRCHVNPLNLYNQVHYIHQVGLIAVNILGSSDIVVSESGATGNPVLRGMIERSFVDERTLPDQDLTMLDHDRFVVKAMSQIQLSKKEAVQLEDFALAKKLKGLEELFSKAAIEISSMEMQKKQATSLEDYDAAQNCHVSSC